MDAENVVERPRDRVELSLDGRQIASVVVGALVLLGLVFVLGLNVGRKLAARQGEVARGDALEALDQPPAAVPPVKDEALTFHDRLTRDGPPPAEPIAGPPAPSLRPPPAQGSTAAAAAAAAVPAPASPAASAPALASASAPVEPGSSARATAPAPAAAARTGGFTVQIVSTPQRAEADRWAAKLHGFSPRVEEAAVLGKGKTFRVRLGSFATRREAQRFLAGVTAKTGAKGLVVATR